KTAHDLAEVIDISRATVELYGKDSKEHMLRMTTAEVVIDEELDAFREMVLSFLAGQTTFEIESKDTAGDGSEIIVRRRMVIPPKHRGDWSRVIYAIEDITDRKRAEDALRDSEARLLQAQETARIGHFVWDAKTNGVIHRSDVIRDIYGVSPDQAPLMFADTLAFIHPDDRERVAAAFKAADVADEGYDVEYRIVRPDGDTRHVQEIANPERDETGRTVRSVGTFQDITERKRAEAALRESEDRYARAVAGTNDGIWDWNIQTGENYFSPRWKAILGYGEDELTHHVDTFFDHVHPDDRALVDEANRAHFEKRKPNDFEFRMRHKDGHYVWVRERGQAVWDSDGKPLRMAGSLSDITERRAAEEAIRTRDAWLRGIMENAPMEIVLKDTDGKIMAISRNVAAEVGRPREDYIGRTTADFLPAKIAEIYMKADREVVESGRLVQQEVVEENPDGSPRHMLNAKFPLKDDKGKIIGICSLTTDVTEMKEVQAQLHQAQKMEAVGQLTGGIAHDFNNLLAIVMGNIELIEDEIEGDGALGGYLKAAFSAVDDAATLTQSLLAFSRNQPLMPKVADMNTLVRKMIGLVGRTLGEAIIIKTSFADDLAPVSIDSGQLQNALLNLVVNARDAMPNGGEIYIETGSLTVGGEGGESDPLAGPGDYVSLTVRDTGEGMPRDVLEHVFEPFFTTKEVGEGSGLGLSMVFGFVKQSGGHVTIHSEVGRGATVTLCLPTTTEAISDEKKPIRDLDARGGGETILFVEDDERVLHIIVDQLSGMGYEVHHARDGGAALDIVDRIPAIDLLLTDVKLPGGMNGAELALEMRRRLPSLPVLYASGHSAAELKKAGHLKDNADLIEKPFTRRELAAKVAAMLS
ncbi:MAG: PAS domain S-box protein, partial [Proteobacteria bacterium]|nr:PAS domain S-box protein [Pseudomonadota bacterium]